MLLACGTCQQVSCCTLTHLQFPHEELPTEAFEALPPLLRCMWLYPSSHTLGTYRPPSFPKGWVSSCFRVIALECPLPRSCYSFSSSYLLLGQMSPLQRSFSEKYLSTLFPCLITTLCPITPQPPITFHYTYHCPKLCYCSQLSSSLLLFTSSRF